MRDVGWVALGSLLWLSSIAYSQEPIDEPPFEAPTVENAPPAQDTPVLPPPPLVQTPPGIEAPPLFPPPPMDTNPSDIAPITPPAVAPTPRPDLAPVLPPDAPAITPQDSDPTVTRDTEVPGGRYSIESPNGVLYDMQRGLAVAGGEVTFRYNEFEVRGDRGVVDYNNNIATITGNLEVRVRGRMFSGESLVFDLNEGTWELSQLETVFPPEIFPPGTVTQPIYAQARNITGDDEDVRGADIQFSSCDRDHYYFRAKRLDFYRDEMGEPDRIVLRQNSLYVFDKKVLPLPVFVISLKGARSRRYGLQPTVGQNDFDGFFVKTAYDLSATQRRTDTLLIDALQKRGLGLGFQRELSGGAGLAYLYMLSGKGPFGRQIDSRLQRRWQITPQLASNFNFQSTNNSTQGSDLSARNGDLSFVYGTPRINSNLFLRFAESGTSGGTYSNTGLTFQHRQKFGEGWDLSLDSLYNGTRFGATSRTATLDNTLSMGRQGSVFDTLLRLELHDDLTGNNRNGAYLLERLPELTLVSDTDRLGLPFFNRYLPGQLELSMGQFNEPATAQRLTRTLLGYTLRQREFRLLQAGNFESKLQTAGRFGQAFYSDDTARYNYDFLVNWSNTLGSLSTQVNYYKQKSVGYTPFQFDFLSPGESVDATLSYLPSDKFRLNLSTGRDLQNGFTRDLVGTIQFAPSRSIYGSVGFSYSPENNQLGDITSNLRLSRSPDRFLGGTLDLGVRYSPQNNQLARVNTALDLFVTRKTRIQALSSYNGFTQEFDFNQIRLTQDLHCFNLYMTYDAQRQQFRLDLAIKAFPFVDTRFGQGPLGTGFDPYVGQAR